MVGEAQIGNETVKITKALKFEGEGKCINISLLETGVILVDFSTQAFCLPKEEISLLLFLLSEADNKFNLNSIETVKNIKDLKLTIYEED